MIGFRPLRSALAQGECSKARQSLENTSRCRGRDDFREKRMAASCASGGANEIRPA